MFWRLPLRDVPWQMTRTLALMLEFVSKSSTLQNRLAAFIHYLDQNDGSGGGVATHSIRCGISGEQTLDGCAAARRIRPQSSSSSDLSWARMNNALTSSHVFSVTWSMAVHTLSDS